MSKAGTLISLALFEHALERAQLFGQCGLDAQLKGVDLARCFLKRRAEAPDPLFFWEGFDDQLDEPFELCRGLR